MMIKKAYSIFIYNLAVAFCYFLSGYLVQQYLSIPPDFASAIWPPAGVALAALLLKGYRVCPGIWIGAMALNSFNAELLFNQSSHVVFYPAFIVPAIIALGATLQACTGNYLIKQYIGTSNHFIEEKYILNFVLLGGFVACFISPTIGTSILMLNEIIPQENYFTVWATWWIGDFIGVVLVAPIIILWLDRSSDDYDLKRSIAVTLPLLIVFAFIVTMLTFVRNSEIEITESNFNKLISTIKDDFRASTDGYTNVAYVMEGMFKSSDDVSRTEFTRFSARLKQLYSGIDYILWVPAITAAKRAIYEEKRKESRDFKDYKIIELDSQENEITAGKRNKYFPIHFIQPSSEGQALYGLDVRTVPGIWSVMEDSLILGQPVISYPKELFSAMEKEFILLSMPVINRNPGHHASEDRGELLRGFVLILLDKNTIFSNMIKSEDIADKFGTGLDIMITDNSDPENILEIYHNIQDTDKSKDKNIQMSREFTLHFAKHFLNFKIDLSPNEITASRGFNVWIYFIISLTFSIIFSILLLLITGRTLLVNRIVDQRTSELTRAKEAAEKSNRVKDNFLATVSHELRTPLQGIIGIVGLFANTSMNKNQVGYLDRLSLSSRHLLALVNDLLDISKSEYEQLDLVNSEFSIKEILNETEKSFSLTAIEKNLTLEFKVDNTIPDILVSDPQRIQQILWNLVSNAFKYTDNGGVIVTANVTDSNEEEISITISVKDTGVGIPSDQHKLVFTKFYRVGNDTSETISGTGLGLSIAKHIVEEMGGELNLSSSLNQGSEFSFTLAFRVPKISIQDNSIDDSYKDHIDHEQSIQILLVDDVEMNRFVITKQLLSTWVNSIIDIAVNGEEAVMKAKEKHYDVILMDLQMPVMDGHQAVAEIRKLSGPSKDSPIIALTAGMISPSELKESGFNGLVRKPFKSEELIKEIGKFIS